MNLTRPNQLTRFTDYRSGVGMEHPMLLRGAGIVTIAAACTSAANALALTLIMLVLCLSISVVYIFERGEYRQPMRTVIYLVPSAILMCLCGLAVNAVSPTTAQSLGMYLPLAAVDSLVLARLQADAPFLPPAQAMPEALALWWLYAVVALPVGALRELFGRGTVFGWRLLLSVNAGGMHLAFAGFLLSGFALAVWQGKHK
jgi:Na+-translocating ferredoxin:NAD+ oxidoreductase RnfE subunit